MFFHLSGKTLIVVPSLHNAITIVDLGDGGSRAELIGHEDSITDFEFLPDGSLVSSSLDGSVRIWRLRGPPVRRASCKRPRGSVPA